MDNEIVSGSEVLSEALGNIVLVKLKGGRTIRGTLKCFDQHLNLVLEESIEINEDGKELKKLGQIIVRGDNVVLVSPSKL
ncbi:MAG: LSm family protein [Candidatus Methanomethylicia archaeon]